MIGEDDMTLAGRIRIGMAAKGIKNPSELARRLKMNRQTVHKWLAGEVVALDPDSLFKVSHLLELNPTWVATRDGDPQPPRMMSPDDLRVIELYHALPKQLQRAWLRSGDAMLEDSGEKSRASPFVKNKAT